MSDQSKPVPDADEAMRIAAEATVAIPCCCIQPSTAYARHEAAIREHIAPVIDAKDGEIEQWKSAYHRELQVHDNTRVLRAALRADRDEWKRKAEAAEAELGDMTAQAQQCAMNFEEVYDRMVAEKRRSTELEAQLAAARKDTARLDWREQNPHDSGPLPKWQDIHDPPGIVWVYGPKQTQYKTLRQALDAAREKGPTA